MKRASSTAGVNGAAATVATTMARMIMMPPIVGVPLLA